ncbi:hypothetical protein H0H87_000954 [Tephrocybe sp. NHM501043]|nr:hypothetical protein H0H87_000954 [Tephrocybe sp. NHM501043]
MAPVIELRIIDIAAYSLGAWLVFKLLKLAYSNNWRGLQTTPLRGPQSASFLFGLSGIIRQAEDASVLTEQWAKEYGSAFCVPGAMGSMRIVITDPKAVTHFYSKETFGYIQTPLARTFIERLLKDNWDAHLDSSPTVEGVVIDVQKWMNHVSLDSIGIAGFSHDFRSLSGSIPTIVRVFESLKTGTSPLSLLVFLLGSTFPILLKLPTSDNTTWTKLHDEMAEIAQDLLERTRKERERGFEGGHNNTEEKSIIGLLIKAETASGQLQMSPEEIMAQMVSFSLPTILRYETTSISLTWALIELSRKPEKQQKLRDELSRFSTVDPTWEQLVSDLPYLDSVVHEAAEDDIIPLSTPITTATGEIVSNIIIKKGTLVSAPIRAINRSEAFWGPNAKEFEPERWLDESDYNAKQIQGHRNILTFSDGPRICLGRAFALAEFKVRSACFH